MADNKNDAAEPKGSAEGAPGPAAQVPLTTAQITPAPLVSSAFAEKPDVSAIDFDTPGVERPSGHTNYLHANPNNSYSGGRYWINGGWVNAGGERIDVKGEKIMHEVDGKQVPVMLRGFDSGNTPVAEGVPIED